MSQSDTHPPFYFWILHLWTLLFNVDYWTGRVLNIVFNLITLFVIVRLVEKLSRNREQALLTGAVWFLGAGTLEITLIARHYALLALITALYAYVVYRFVFAPPNLKPHGISIIMIGSTTAAGMLTHFLFGLVIFASLCAVIYRYRLKAITRLGYLGICLGIDALFFLVLLPEFYLQFANQATVHHIPRPIIWRFVNILKMFTNLFVGLTTFPGLWQSLRLSFVMPLVLFLAGIGLIRHFGKYSALLF